VRRLTITFCALATCLAAPVAAHAATYTVAVCDPAAGNADNAMAFSSNIAHNISSAQSCDGVGKGRGLQTWSSSATRGAHAGAWWFYAPAGTSITHLSYRGDFSAFDGWVSHWATNRNGSGDPDPAGDCPTANRACTKGDGGVRGGASVSTAVGGATTLGFGIWCDASSCPANDSGSAFGPAGSANVYDADISVSDPGPPTLSVSGNLWGISPSVTIAGGAQTWTLDFGASDPAGPCELQAVIENSAGAVVLSDQDNVGANYTEPAPCGAANRDTSWQPNLSSLATGTYHLYIGANDPAGMASPVLAERLNINDNGPALQPTTVTITGVHALGRRCRGDRRHRRCRYVALKHGRGPLSLSFGQRGQATGIAKTAGGAPLARSPIDVYAHSRAWSTRLIATLLTNSAGQFSYPIMPGPSRTLTFEFPGAGTVLDSLAPVDVNVNGRATLTLTGGLVASRRAVFEGRVLGGYIPTGGKLLQLRYRIPGVTGWAPFGPDIYAGRSGRWRAPVGIVAGARDYTYELDVLVPAQSDWPFGQTVSRTVKVTVR
jgi:hypothetical protein